MKVLHPLLAVSLLSLLFGCGPRASPFERAGAGWKFKGVPLTGIENATFTPLDANFGKDARRVYFCTTEREASELFTVKRARALVLAGADPGTFRVLRNRYARDARAAFYEHEAFAVRDLETFEVLEYNFARDRLTGYFACRPVEGSDGATFAGLDSRYARDRNSVFHGEIQPGPNGIRVIAARLPGAQPASFAALDDGYASDAGQAYFRGRVISGEVGGFTVLGFGYARSATQVFYQGEVLPTADARSFNTLVPPTSDADARDARGDFLQGKRVIR